MFCLHQILEQICQEILNLYTKKCLNNNWTKTCHSFHFKPNIANRRSFIDKLKFPYFLGKSKYILVDDYHPMIYKLQFRKPRNSSSMACRGCFQDCRI